MRKHRHRFNTQRCVGARHIPEIFDLIREAAGREMRAR
jgi:hypothetical protein